MKCIVCGNELSNAGTSCTKCGATKTITSYNLLFVWSAKDKEKVKELKDKYSSEAAKQRAEFEKIRQENIRREEQKRIQEESRRLEEQRKSEQKKAEERVAAERKAAETKRIADDKKKVDPAKAEYKKRESERRAEERKNRADRIREIILAVCLLLIGGFAAICVISSFDIMPLSGKIGLSAIALVSLSIGAFEVFHKTDNK